MPIAPVQVERRVGQRFPFSLPVSFRTTTGIEGLGFTQDLSSRGVYFLTAALLREGDQIELTLTMPSEITLGESMRVRCRGRVLRIVNPAAKAPKISDDIPGEIASPRSAPSPAAEAKISVAVLLEGYDYLPDARSASGFPRVSVLRADRERADREEDKAISRPER
jgi:hypothetical protein